MNVGIPTEIKPDERRVALTPAGAAALRSHGHRVLVQSGAGVGSGFSDASYRAAGAAILNSARDVWRRSDMMLKVKEPQPPEYPLMRRGMIVFTYLHLAADKRLSRELIRRRVTAVGYETIQLDDMSLPLLAPMSEVAGRLAIQAGSWCLQARAGGRGVLLSGASGVRPGKVVVLGGGIAGLNACRVGAGVGAEVTIMDINPTRLRYLGDMFGGRVTTVMSNRATIDEEVVDCDLVVGTVLVPGARTPRLISAKMVARMRPGAAIVDLSIDQGGVSETSKPTTHARPTFIHSGVVHYCVTNMPAMVPHTSTYALTNATLSYALEIADHGILDAGNLNPAIRHGLNIFDGRVTHPAVADALKMKPHSPWD
ncbi:MAG TPA: alanine dehydrogenase [Candidatus Acidoferrales bacterium]|nr:alanine dehydrogenase [Candidatus Acidoferrales bacterium]